MITSNSNDKVQAAFEQTISNGVTNGSLNDILDDNPDMLIEEVAQYILDKFIAVDERVATASNFDFILDHLLMVQGQAV